MVLKDQENIKNRELMLSNFATEIIDQLKIEFEFDSKWSIDFI